MSKMYYIGADGKPTPIDEPVTQRERIAIAAMQAILTRQCWQSFELAEIAVAHADALIAELRKEVHV